MPEQNKPFVITDRRRFNSEGELRPDADPSPEREQRPEQILADGRSARIVEAPQAPIDPPTPPSELQSSPASEAPHHEEPEADLPPALTEDQIAQAKLAYDQTADRLDTAVRAANPGMDRIPEMNFDRLVQSVYMTAIMQMGGTTAEGEQPRIDLMGARQSVDMLNILSEKTKGNLAEPERLLLESALFELRMGFLEVTQALARSAQARAQGTGAPSGPGGVGGPGGFGGPSIVR